MSRRLKGKALPSPRNTLFNLINQSYNPSASKNVDGWNLITETPTLKFYNLGNDIIVVIRGTYNSEDVLADTSIALNKLESSSRFQKDLKVLTSFIQQYPNFNYYGVGHSLGGAILDLFLRKGLLKEGQSYNPAIQPQDFRNTLPVHRIFMSGDPLYTLVKLFLYQKPEVIEDNTSTFTKLARFTPIGNVLTAPTYLKSHGLEQFKGKGGMKCKKCGLLRKGKGNTASPLHKELFKKKFLEMRKAQTEQEIAKDTRDYHQLKDQMEYIDPADDLEYELAQGEKEAIKKDIIKGKEDLKLFNKHTRINKVGLQNKYEELPAAPTVLPLVKIPRKSPLNPNGKGKPEYSLHDVIVHKPFPLDQAREIARDIMKSNKDKFMRETSTSYRFRNIPKTKFSSFFTKVLNPQVSLIFGVLK